MPSDPLMAMYAKSTFTSTTSPRPMAMAQGQARPLGRSLVVNVTSGLEGRVQRDRSGG